MQRSTLYIILHDNERVNKCVQFNLNKQLTQRKQTAACSFKIS